jgi:hypothetical protein
MNWITRTLGIAPVASSSSQGRGAIGDTPIMPGVLARNDSGSHGSVGTFTNGALRSLRYIPRNGARQGDIAEALAVDDTPKEDEQRYGGMVLMKGTRLVQSKRLCHPFIHPSSMARNIRAHLKKFIISLHGKSEHEKLALFEAWLPKFCKRCGDSNLRDVADG